MWHSRPRLWGGAADRFLVPKLRLGTQGREAPLRTVTGSTDPTKANEPEA